MDPSVNLAEQIMICYNVINGKPVDTNRLAELVLNLHEWMRKGGHPPKQWKEQK